MRQLYTLLVILAFIPIHAEAQTINVPSQHSTIQAALNAASSGDTVLVQPGTYTENITWPATNGIKLISAGDTTNTIIDGGSSGRVIDMSSGTIDTTTVIRGFQLTNGEASSWGEYGAGLYLNGVSPLLDSVRIAHNKVTGNARAYGVGIHCSNGSPIFRHVSIVHNKAESSRHYGGGIHCSSCNAAFYDSEISYNSLDTTTYCFGAGVYLAQKSNAVFKRTKVIGNTLASGSFGNGGGFYISDTSNAVLTNVLIAKNSVYEGGGTVNGAGIYSDDSQPVITNATIVDNIASNGTLEAGGIFQGYNGDQYGPIVINSILWNPNASSEFYPYAQLDSVIYSDVKGGYAGTGNLDTLPEFVGSGDYDLQSTSPVIDKGTSLNAPNRDMQGILRVNPDMGAYEYPNQVAGIEEEQEETVRVYPNPASSHLWIEHDIEGRSRIMLLDATGKRVIDRNLNRTRTQLDVGELPEGLYFYSLRNQEGKVVKAGKLSILAH